jgi:hypothetical protein
MERRHIQIDREAVQFQSQNTEISLPPGVAGPRWFFSKLPDRQPGKSSQGC